MLYKRASAKRDLVEHYVYLAEQGGTDVAERFLAQFEESCADLVRHPDMGTAASGRCFDRSRIAWLARRSEYLCDWPAGGDSKCARF